MEFKSDKIEIKDNEVTFTVIEGDIEQLRKYNKEIRVEVKEWREKRTHDQNSYFWVLIKEIALKMKANTLDIYKKYIMDRGVFQIVPIKDEAVIAFTKKWESKGMGWFCKSMGESKIKGFTKLVVYFGSSSYNTEEMGNLIEGVIDDCEELGIVTKTKAEFMAMANENDDKA